MAPAPLSFAPNQSLHVRPLAPELRGSGAARFLRRRMKLHLARTTIGFIGCLFLGSSLAYAQATRTWVSGVGSDANPCSRTAPCQTFAGAISKTAVGGEINCLDPAGFGAVTITKSITISCPSTGTPGVLATLGSTGIVINPPANAEVLLQGLDIEGAGTGNNGVNIISATKVTIQSCSIRNFAGNGVNLAGPVGARVVVLDSLLLSNNIGVNIAGIAGAANTALLLRTVIDNHPVASVNVAAGGTLIMSASKLTGSPTSVALAGGTTFTSFGDNAIQAAGNPTNTIPLR